MVFDISQNMAQSNTILQPRRFFCSIKIMSIFTKLRQHAVVSSVLVAFVVIVAVIAGRAATQKAAVVNISGIKQVSLVNVAAFREGSAFASAYGVVQSHSQADLKSQTSAPISSIDVSIGQNVSVGQVLIELSNNDIRAQLAQTEAALSLAQGQFQTGAVSLDSAKQSAIDKLRDSYIKTYDAVVSQAETILYNNDGNGGRLISYSMDTLLNTEITQIDQDLKDGLLKWKAANDSLVNGSSTASVEAVIRIAEKNMASADRLLTDMSKVLNNLSNSALPAFSVSLNSWKGVVSGARSSVSGAEQALTAAEMAMNTASSSQGGTASASIAAARASVENLQAQLAKTIIRSPINGKVSALPLREGELALPGSLLATVIGNDSALEIKSYVSGEDLSRVKVDATVTIQAQGATTNASTTKFIKGVVSNIAPGVDSVTRKAEVDIDVTDSAYSNLIIGQNAAISIMAKDSAMTSSAVYKLPIQDVKIIPGAAYVLTVDEASKIKRNDVTLGRIQGDFIEVTGGLTDDMSIVSPVYELEEGQEVRVQ